MHSRYLFPLLILLACDVPPAPLPGSTGEASTGEPTPTTQAPDECGGLACTIDPAGLHMCSTGLECVPHPGTGALACVAPCSSDGCPGPALDCSGEPAKGECLPDVDGVPSCFVIGG